MARGRGNATQHSTTPSNDCVVEARTQPIQLESRLVLLAWLNNLLGYQDNRELLDDIKRADEGFDSLGRSHICRRLLSRGSKLRIPEADLTRYDENIRAYLKAMNRNRIEPITLRYFQYLAVLYTEVFLDRLFNNRAKLLADLNAFVKGRNATRSVVEQTEELFADEDLSKLAYWMATGSGKTLILHLNYYQFMHYNKEPLSNVLLITTGPDLSDQHLAELEASGIPARRFDVNRRGTQVDGRHAVQVIEITKLVEQKRGGGVSVPVDFFEGRNLVFVDEGHKGSGGEAWRKYREALGTTGFTFEYSATFGQALSAARNDPLTDEYGKAIIFDYSYKYFYGDGYGKDFRVLNLASVQTDQQTELLLLGNLLSFYEQRILFEQQSKALHPYNLEKPLWVFVGSTVNAVYSEGQKKRSDVLTVVRFLQHVLENASNWVITGIGELLEGRSGLLTVEGRDVFQDRFPYLRELGIKPDEVYRGILSTVLHAPGRGNLQLCEIKRANGELGLKVSGAEEYFGLVYIGDTAEFKKLVEEDASGMVLEEDAISDSLFEGISNPETSIDVLIGAKKFMEGWNSWRVSAMGLLNIGRHEGSQIIQLFGRGVRLRGKGFLLKRSAALPGDHPPHIGLLETLNVFAVRADYMGAFRSYLEREGVETDEMIQLPLRVWPNENFLRKGLLVPRLPDGNLFESDGLVLQLDPTVTPHVELSMRVETIDSGSGRISSGIGQLGRLQRIPPESLALIDWERVYLDLLVHKNRRGWSNMVIPPEIPRRILEAQNYTLVCDDEVIRPTSFAARKRLQEAVEAIVRSYAEVFYRKRRQYWDSRHMVYRPLEKSDPNLSFGPFFARDGRVAYTVRVPSSRRKVLEAVESLLKDKERLLKGENDNLPRIYFDRHVYLPLLLHKGETSLEANPPPLEESEARFVRDLKKYWELERDRALAGKEIFLLRNLSRGKGVSFFVDQGFYPDFILWVVDSSCQRVIFVEPHGLLHSVAYTHDGKARLWECLPSLAEEISRRSRPSVKVVLDSFIISATTFSDLHKRYDDGTWDMGKFAEKHILFPVQTDDYDYMDLIFRNP
jgi:hypothetical protein